MKTWTATPEEFAKGTAGVRFLKKAPRTYTKPKRGPEQPRQIGTITPEDFGAGRPFWGHRSYGHRTAPVNTLKPLPESIVDKLLETGEADVDMRQLKKLFKPGTCWTRINYHFPFKSYGPDGQLTVTPPGTPVPVTVQRVLPDGIAFQLPSGETSYLAWPDGVNARSNLTMSGGLMLFDKNGRELLSYQPCAT